MKRSALAVLVLMLALTAAAARAAPAPPYEQMVTKCRTVVADQTILIPEAFTKRIVPSGSGSHGYDTGCRLWVVDFYMNSKSNSYVDPGSGKRVHERTEFYGIPHDLPSSATADGRYPAVKEDCERVRFEHILYTRASDDPSFDLRRHVISVGGSWNAATSTCALAKPPTALANKIRVRGPESGGLLIRVAVRVRLRTSWQEAAAYAGDLPPE